MERIALKVRGTVPPEHALHAMCFDKAPNLAFKLLLNLADDAKHAREGLARMLIDHPLNQTLSNLMPHEALAFLLGITKMGHIRSDSPDSPVTTSPPPSVGHSPQSHASSHSVTTPGKRAVVQPEESQPPGKSAALSLVTVTKNETAPLLEVAEDDFLLLSGHPGTP